MAPENTAPAFDFGLSHGADVLEIDVRVSRDCEVIVIHDSTVGRTTDGSGSVREHTLAALKKLDSGYRFCVNGSYPQRGRDVRLLTLGELLQRYPEVPVNIDIKDNDPQAVALVAKVIAAASAEHRTVVASFHDSNLVCCRDQFPALRTSAGKRDVLRYYRAWLSGRPVAHTNLCQLFQLPTRYYCLSLSSERFIESIHNTGAKVNYWTINKPAQMKKLLRRGADGIVTDRADLAAEVFREFDREPETV